MRNLQGEVGLFFIVGVFVVVWCGFFVLLFCVFFKAFIPVG